MPRSEVYNEIQDQEVKARLQECEVAKSLNVSINYELFKLVEAHFPKKYKFKKDFVEKALINQLKMEGVLK